MKCLVIYASVQPISVTGFISEFIRKNRKNACLLLKSALTTTEVILFPTYKFQRRFSFLNDSNPIIKRSLLFHWQLRFKKQIRKSFFQFSLFKKKKRKNKIYQGGSEGETKKKTDENPFDRNKWTSKYRSLYSINDVDF